MRRQARELLLTLFALGASVGCGGDVSGPTDIEAAFDLPPPPSPPPPSICFDLCRLGDVKCMGTSTIGVCQYSPVGSSPGCLTFVPAYTCPSSAPICDRGSCGCIPGTTQCSSTTPQTCSASQRWVSNAVQAGVCGANCTPGNGAGLRCSGTASQTCGPNGQWSDLKVVAGNCGADCTPGVSRLRCNGATVQGCSPEGHWQDQTTCASGCSGGACTSVSTSSGYCGRDYYHNCVRAVGGTCCGLDHTLYLCTENGWSSRAPC
jgi:hypothetical protein